MPEDPAELARLLPADYLARLLAGLVRMDLDADDLLATPPAAHQ